MLSLIKPFLTLRFVKFCTVGASGVLVNLGSLALMADLLGLQSNLAAAIAIEISINTNFLVNELWTFRDRRREGGAFSRLVRFHLVSLVGAGLQWTVFVVMNMIVARFIGVSAEASAGAGLLELVVDAVTTPPPVGNWMYLSQLTGIGVATVWNFTANFYWTWRHRDKEGQSE